MTKVSPSLAHCSAYTLVVSLSQLESTFCVHTERESAPIRTTLLCCCFCCSRFTVGEKIYMLNELIINMDTMGGRRRKTFQLTMLFQGFSCYLLVSIFLVLVWRLLLPAKSIIWHSHRNDMAVFLSFTGFVLSCFNANQTSVTICMCVFWQLNILRTLLNGT